MKSALVKSLDIGRAFFSVDPQPAENFFQADGPTYRYEDRFFRNDLAWSLQQISEQRPEGLCGASDPRKAYSLTPGY